MYYVHVCFWPYPLLQTLIFERSIFYIPFSPESIDCPFDLLAFPDCGLIQWLSLSRVCLCLPPRYIPRVQGQPDGKIQYERCLRRPFSPCDPRLLRGKKLVLWIRLRQQISDANPTCLASMTLVPPAC